MQHGSAPVERHDKWVLCTMDESSILRRRGLQVGEQKGSALYRELCGGGCTVCLCETMPEAAVMFSLLQQNTVETFCDGRE